MKLHIEFEAIDETREKVIVDSLKITLDNLADSSTLTVVED